MDYPEYKPKYPITVLNLKQIMCFNLEKIHIAAKTYDQWLP